MTVEQRLDQLEKLKRRLGLANLVGAILKDVNLTGANLKHENLEGAIDVPLLSAKQEEDARRSDCG